MVRARIVPLILMVVSSSSVAFADEAGPSGLADVPPLKVTEPPRSLGQPPRLQWMWGPSSGVDFGDELAVSRLNLGLIRRGRIPQFGIGDQTIELSVGHVDRELDWVGAVYSKIPLIHVGVEWSRVDGFEPVLSARYAIPRGGLFRNGDLWRLDYGLLENEWRLGLCINFPLTKYRRSRSRAMHVSLPDGPRPRATDRDSPSLSPDLLRSLDAIDHAIRWMDRLLTPRFDTGDDFAKSARDLRDHVRSGHTFAREDATYHRELAAAFAIAAGDDAARGAGLAACAESVVLHRVLVPYNRLFGQNKSPHHLGGYVPDALAAFEDSLTVRFGRDPADARSVTCREVFRRVLVSIDEAARAAAKRWRQSQLFWLKQARLVWLPLNYGLRPEQIDSQEEWDRIHALLTGTEWTDANAVEYLLNNQFHLELKRMIRDTVTYQVIILHDFRGRIAGATDTIGWDVVVDGYIRAFAEAVRAVDAGERDAIPRFFLFLDEHFYAVNRSRPIITFLEHLYETSDVELSDPDTERRVNAAHAELLELIRTSPSLRGLAEEDLADLFRVYVNVTNQYDPAFTFDSLIRDHRKLAFRDVSEEDPGAGEGIFTGQGIGEHYNGPAWEDRSLGVRGPALLALKTAARRLFRSQGFREDEVPPSLRPLPLPDDYAQRCLELRARGWTARVLTTMNETGYGDKGATVLKAVTYNLLPPDAFLFSLDSLWISDYWASMFVAAALRGAQLHPVGPAAKNAPSSALPVMVLMRDTLDMMLQARGFFREEIEAAGGSLRVGLYDHEVPVYDLRRRVDTFLNGRAEHPFLREAFPLHPSVLTLLREATDELGDAPDAEGAGEEEGDLSSVALEAEHRPFIHLKGQLVATRGAIRILEQEEWTPILRRYLAVRNEQVRGLPNEGVTPALLEARDEGTPGLLAAFHRAIDADPSRAGEPVVFELTIGSQNMDRLSMLRNGEVLVAVSGPDALVSLTDFMFIVGTAAWPETPDELDDVFPRPGGFGLLLRRVFRYIQDLV